MKISGSRDQRIKIWDSFTYKLINTLEGHDDWLASLAIIPSNQYIISGSYDTTIKVWKSS